MAMSSLRSWSGSLAWALLLVGCSPAAELEPSRGRGQGGEWVHVRSHDLAAHGGVVVRFGGVPGRAVVIESDTLLRVMTPSVPRELRGQPLAVELRFADGVTRTLDATYEFEIGLDVR
jgi:hypothetical protein